MNLEEMQQAWKELNERVARNEILHREEVKRILNTRRESCLEKLTRVGITGLAITATVCLVYVAAWIARPGFHILPAITGAILVFYGLIAQIAGLHNLLKIKRETNLETQIRHILRYKSLYNCILLASYPIIALFVLFFVYYYGTRFNIIVTSLLLAACVIADYFIFHHTHDRVKQMVDANRELRQIEEDGGQD